MEQELTSTSDYTVAVVGGGPSGCICAKTLSDSDIAVTVFDKGKFLRTLLPTGGGRCNLANAQYNFKELAKNYPRGEKFLYSVFSRFGTQDTLDLFKSIGIDTYTQDDKRIFPVSNSSADVRKKILESLKCKLIKETVLGLEKLTEGYKLTTNKSKYYFDKIVIATGGHCGYDLAKMFDIHIISPTQSLVGLTTSEDFSSISGVSIKNIKTKINNKEICGDIIFTHKGISGPLIYTISSIWARKELPYKINLNIISNIDLQKELNNNPHKEIKNVISEYIPKSFAKYILNSLNIDIHTPAHKINKIQREKICNKLISFEINITDKIPDSEVVTCGGIDLNEINPKTMESKKYKGLYFCGEVLDIDGYCGGFNLQNCWATGYLTAKAIIGN